MKILSLFDGISIAQQAFKELGFEVEYYASEIDKQAISITQKNHPNTEQLGDIKDIDCTGGLLHYGAGKLAETDIYLLIGGSPCQDLSIAKKNREGLNGKRSGLFWEYVRILKELKPKYFILENVASMPKEAKQTITETLWDIEPVMINASLVSAQNRKRLFWVGKLADKRHIGHWDSADYEKVNISQPHDEGILLKDILEEGTLEIEKAHTIDANYFKGGKKGGTHQSSKRNYTIRLGQFNKGGQGDRVYSPEGKSVSLSALGSGRGAKTGLYAISKPVILGDEPLQVLKEGRTELGKKSRREIREKTGKDSTSRSVGCKAYYGREGIKANCITTGLGAEGMVVENSIIRKLAPIECERLQSLPDNYTEGISNTQRYKTLGNGFNCAVIKHIIKSIL